jgi:hypothetical protein
MTAALVWRAADNAHAARAGRQAERPASRLEVAWLPLGADLDATTFTLQRCRRALRRRRRAAYIRVPPTVTAIAPARLARRRYLMVKRYATLAAAQGRPLLTRARRLHVAATADAHRGRDHPRRVS